MKTLEKMFETQKEFSGHWKNFDSMNDKQKEDTTNDFLLDLYDEVSEIRRANNSKAWKKTADKDMIAEEVGDAFAYLVSICHCYGISADTFANTYFNKMELNEQNYNRREDEKRRTI